MAIQQLEYVEQWDASEFPLHRQRVVATGDGEVLKGHVAVAQAIVESWCADNPVVFVALIEGWIERARAVDDQDREWHRRWEDRLNYSPHLVAALEKGPGEVFERAGLTAFQVRAVELMLDGKTKTEIGHALGLSRQAATERIDAALEKILALDGIPALPVLGI